MVLQWELFNEIIEDGMLTGYLLDFCRENYCCENFEFLLAVKKFHDLFTTGHWVSWRELDAVPETDALYAKSKKVFEEVFDAAHEKQIETEITLLWQHFLDPAKATAEVCLAYDILDNTQRRMDFFKSYGPNVFAEATLEPTKTMVRDIVPRYMASSQYMDMLKRRQMRDSLPPVSDLKIPFPQSRISSKKQNLSTSEGRFEYSCVLENYIRDYFLYDKLLKYLQKSVCGENLLCYRAIDVFKQYMVLDSKKEEGLEMGWIIYFYFLCVGASQEVSVGHDVLYNISRNMCKLEINTFDDIQKSIRLMLEEQLISFRMSSDFADLQVLLAKRDKEGSSKVAPEVGSDAAVNGSPRTSRSFFVSWCFGASPELASSPR
jgi:hypothetical protein